MFSFVQQAIEQKLRVLNGLTRCVSGGLLRAPDGRGPGPEERAHTQGAQLPVLREVGITSTPEAGARPGTLLPCGLSQ